ncbi:hypothetical protein GH714_030277 [Hevea brasiliensis]|uniref:NADP-dependent oxidoreductase domain-containing protein n=1 Tax=Hevea brasiliensis TaxID=3981 RepID=A0A6A6N825_HEVBR|nr:hypothetical protein GH714_030277 [Hevea brasiliensis]
MELRPWGNTGLKISSVGFGASPLGSVFGPVSEDDAVASVREAFRRASISLIPLQPGNSHLGVEKMYYGGTLSEKMLGKGLKALGVPRNEYVVSTKCGRYKEGLILVLKDINDSTLVDLLPYLKSKSVGIISASPLAMGLLTENGPPEWHPASPELKSACQAAAAYCKDKGKSITKLAVQYSLSNKDISTVLVGMNSVGQVEENVTAALELATFGKDQETLAEVEAILSPIKNQTWPSGIQQG